MNMKNLKLIAAGVLAAFALGGCATGYDKYLAQIAEINKQQVDQAEFRMAATRSDNDAIATLAASGSDTVKVAASMSIMMSNVVASIANGGGGGKQNFVIPQAPKDPMESLMQLAGIVIPSAVQGFGILKNAQVAIHQSDNSAAIEISHDNAFTAIATNAINGVASVNVQPNVTTNINAGQDAIYGNNNSTTRRNCNGGSPNATGNGGAAAAGGAGGAGSGTTGGSGGAGAASGNAGSGTPSATGSGGNC